MFCLDTETEQAYDRIKVKFTNSQYHIQEIGEFYDLETVKSFVPEYIELAKNILGIDDSVDVEYVRGLRVDDDESVD